jgi:hypothetical protein
LRHPARPVDHELRREEPADPELRLGDRLQGDPLSRQLPEQCVSTEADHDLAPVLVVLADVPLEHRRGDAHWCRLLRLDGGDREGESEHTRGDRGCVSMMDHSTASSSADA